MYPSTGQGGCVSEHALHWAGGVPGGIVCPGRCVCLGVCAQGGLQHTLGEQNDRRL